MRVGVTRVRLALPERLGAELALDVLLQLQASGNIHHIYSLWVWVELLRAA